MCAHGCEWEHVGTGKGIWILSSLQGAAGISPSGQMGKLLQWALGEVASQGMDAAVMQSSLPLRHRGTGPEGHSRACGGRPDLELSLPMTQ